MMKDDRIQLSRRGFVQTAALAAGGLGAANLSRAAAADVKIVCTASRMVASGIAGMP